MLSSRGPALAGSASILDRASPASLSFTKTQAQVEGLVGGFVQEATDWKSLAALTAGGLGYRTARLGVMGFGNGTVLQAVSVGLGLTAEVSAFELVHRGLSSTGSMLHNNLWRWNGTGGLHQGLLQSFITFGTLKGAGRLAQGENLIAQHLFQDSAMVLGHQAAGTLGITPRPTGTLAEQFLHAEATTLQLGAGMALAHGFAPGLHGLERGMDLAIPSNGVGARPQRAFESTGAETAPLQLINVAAEGPDFPTWFAMSAIKGKGPRGPRTGDTVSSTSLTAEKERQREAQDVLRAAGLKAAETEGQGEALKIAQRLIEIYPTLSAVPQGFVDRGIHKFLRSDDMNLFLLGAALLGRTLKDRKDLSNLNIAALLLAKKISPTLPLRGGVVTVLRNVAGRMPAKHQVFFLEDLLRVFSRSPWDGLQVFKEIIPGIPERVDRISAVQIFLRRLEEKTGHKPGEAITSSLEALVGPPPAPEPKRKSRKKK